MLHIISNDVRSESTTSNSIDTVYGKRTFYMMIFLVLNERNLKVQCRRDIRRVKATYCANLQK